MKKKFMVGKVIKEQAEPIPDVTVPTEQPQEEHFTLKTVQLPEKYFWMIKEECSKRRIKQKQFWLEILQKHFNI